MFAPSVGLEAKGTAELEKTIFGFIKEAELKQELE